MYKQLLYSVVLFNNQKMKTHDESLDQLITIAEDAIYDSNYQQARRLLESGLMDEPGYPKLHYTMGWMYHYHLENEVLAERHYLLAIHFDPEYFDAYDELKEFYLSKKKYEALERLMHKAKGVDDIDLDFVYETLGLIAEKRSRFAEAIHHYRKAMMHCIDNYDAKELRQHVRRVRFKKWKRIMHSKEWK